MRFVQFLDESINDKGIFKAVFMAGCPGAGKSYTLERISFGSIMPRIVNTDKMYKIFPKGWNQWATHGDTIKMLTKKQLLHYIDGVLPLAVDGTSGNTTNMIRRLGILESFGYDTAMVWVNTDPETAIKRIKERDRKVPDDYVYKVFDQISKAKAFYKTKFSVFIEVNNGHGELTNDIVIKAFNTMTGFYNSPLTNPIGVANVEKMKENNWKYMSDGLYPLSYIDKSIDTWYRE